MIHGKFSNDKVNVGLTNKVLGETRWFQVDAELNGDKWMQVFASPQLQDVLLVKKEDGDHLWYDDMLYATGNPVAVAAVFERWNLDHGYSAVPAARSAGRHN